jgi:hypothetical protein
MSLTVVGVNEFSRLNGLDSWHVSAGLRQWEVSRSIGGKMVCPVSIEPYRDKDGRWVLSASATWLWSKGPKYKNTTAEVGREIARAESSERDRSWRARRKKMPGRWVNQSKYWKAEAPPSETWKKTLDKKLRAGREESGQRARIRGAPKKREKREKKPPRTGSK